MIDDFVETPMGRKLHFLEPTVDEIHLDDIALGLSRIRRFNGTAERFCSVAEHSIAIVNFIRMTRIRDNALLRAALFHDASEVYICNIPAPPKRHLPDYRSMEDRLMEMIARRFDFPWPLPSLVEELDFRVLNDERRQLLRPSDNIWASDAAVPLGITCYCWPEAEAERQFLRSYQRCCVMATAAE